MTGLDSFGVRSIPPCGDCHDDGTCAMNCSPTMLKVVTDNICPPIPIRQFDWVAYFDGMEEGPHEHGRTEAEAVSRLWASQGRTADGLNCLHCGKVADQTKSCAVGGCPIGNDA